jgi:hypothetical protein
MQGSQHKLFKNTRIPGKVTPSTDIRHIPFTNLTPQTPSEHYWATRAQKAEALLSAREKHYEEIGKIREEEALKRTVCLDYFAQDILSISFVLLMAQAEIQALERGYRAKRGSLEKLVVGPHLSIYTGALLMD